MFPWKPYNTFTGLNQNLKTVKPIHSLPLAIKYDFNNLTLINIVHVKMTRHFMHKCKTRPKVRSTKYTKYKYKHKNTILIEYLLKQYHNKKIE